jgi:colanic acid/amylovoran biosynthesis protein
MPLKIFAPCSYTWGNRGDATLLLAMVEVLRRELGAVEFVFTSFTPDTDAPRYQERVIAMPLSPSGRVSRLIHRDLGRIGLGKLAPFLTLAQLLTFFMFLALWIRIWRLMPRLAEALASPQLVTVAKAARDSDLTVTVPGGYLMAPRTEDDYWLYHVATLAVPLFLGKPVIASACSVGPFAGYHSHVARWLFRRMDLIFVREEVSADHLIGLGVEEARITLTADTAFCFSGSDRAEVEADRVLRDPAALPRPWIGISARDHSFPGCRDPEALFETYLSEMARLADHVVSVLGGSPIFVSQCTDSGGDDAAIALQVRDRMRHHGKALVVAQDVSPEVLQALYRRLDMMVGTRMHANILAMTQLTPVLAIAYQHKTPGIMTMAGLGAHVVDIAEVSGRLIPAFARAWAEREHMRRVLTETIPALRARAARDTEVLRTLLAGTGPQAAAGSGSGHR